MSGRSPNRAARQPGPCPRWPSRVTARDACAVGVGKGWPNKPPTAVLCPAPHSHPYAQLCPGPATGPRPPPRLSLPERLQGGQPQRSSTPSRLRLGAAHRPRPGAARGVTAPWQGALGSPMLCVPGREPRPRVSWVPSPPPPTPRLAPGPGELTVGAWGSHGGDPERSVPAHWEQQPRGPGRVPWWGSHGAQEPAVWGPQAVWAAHTCVLGPGGDAATNSRPPGPSVAPTDHRKRVEPPAHLGTARGGSPVAPTARG